MAVWILGDVQGCAKTLWRLLDVIEFEPGHDTLWLAGDLVNRGPDSLAVLRWCVQAERDHPGHVRSVLGNHDLHLLCRAEGVSTAKRRDTLDALLAAPDLEELTGWLRTQAVATMLELPGERPWLLVHAGLLPQWSVAFVLRESAIAEQLLRGPQRLELLRALVEPRYPVTMQVRLAADFLGQITRLRCLDGDGKPFADFTEAPERLPPGHLPWFDVPGRKAAGQCVLFGHWAALGVRRGPDWCSLDSGCVWGQLLTALRLPDLRTVSVPASG